MGLYYNDKMLEALYIKQDKYHYESTVKMVWKKIYDQPQTMALANMLGYALDSKIDLSHYEKTLYRRVVGKIKSGIVEKIDSWLRQVM